MHKVLRILLLTAGLLLHMHSARAEVVADWGTVLTPLTTEATFTFAQYDISQNFTDEYTFSLEGTSGAVYEVFFSFDSCRNGCGSTEISYGIYDANGGLIGTTSENGSVNLAAGNYTFQVKGTGMGSGNLLDYNGSVAFSAVAVDIVSPAPEPDTLALLLIGLPWVFWRGMARRGRMATPCPTTLLAY